MRPTYTDEEHQRAEALRREASDIERQIDVFHGVCARMQRMACEKHRQAYEIVPTEYARRPA